MNAAATGAATPDSATGDLRAEAMRRLFMHQDGLAIAASAAGLDALGALDRLASARVPVAELQAASRSPGAVAASLRALQSAGWVVLHADGPALTASLSGPVSRRALELYVRVYHRVVLELEGADWASDTDVVARVARAVPTLATVRATVDDLPGFDSAAAYVVSRHLEGILATVALPRLAPATSTGALRVGDSLLRTLGYGDAADASGLGRAARNFQSIYGLMGSYARPALAQARWLNANVAITPAVFNARIDRRLNVLASGAAHQTYFRAAQAIVRKYFDNEDFGGQPNAIVDVGCGDGSWLRRLFELVQSTVRGRRLDRHPLYLIGVDVDDRALDVARTRLADLPTVLQRGDIGDPGGIVASIGGKTGLEPDDLLHVRSFVDHNREMPPGTGPEGGTADPDGAVAVDADGVLLSDAAIRTDWHRHFRQWREYAGRHGIVVIEAHTVRPAELYERQGSCHSLAFEFYHGMSGQSPLRFEAFNAAVEAGGLHVESPQLTFPRQAVPTTSVQRVVPRSRPS